MEESNGGEEFPYFLRIFLPMVKLSEGDLL